MKDPMSQWQREYERDVRRRRVNLVFALLLYIASAAIMVLMVWAFCVLLFGWGGM